SRGSVHVPSIATQRSQVRRRRSTFRRCPGQPPTHGGHMLTRVLRTVRLDTADVSNPLLICDWRLAVGRRALDRASCDAGAAAGLRSFRIRAPYVPRSTTYVRSQPADFVRNGSVVGDDGSTALRAAQATATGSPTPRSPSLPWCGDRHPISSAAIRCWRLHS